jgi:hypothetical protein
LTPRASVPRVELGAVELGAVELGAVELELGVFCSNFFKNVFLNKIGILIPSNEPSSEDKNLVSFF